MEKIRWNNHLEVIYYTLIVSLQISFIEKITEFLHFGDLNIISKNFVQYNHCVRYSEDEKIIERDASLFSINQM